MMEVVRTSETSVNFSVTTRSYIPEDQTSTLLLFFHRLIDFQLAVVKEVD
jgi:hypothetical protein